MFGTRAERSWIALAGAVALLAWAGPAAHADDPPELATWKRNTTGLTGYNGLPADVQKVRYSAGNVYITCSSIPDYSIGPWPGNPNTPTNQAYVMRFPRSPVENTGTKTSTPLGPIGLWINGLAIFNALDAHSYNNQNIWHQNAVVVEAVSFDGCLGHPAPGGAYHNHQNVSCLYGANPEKHSQLLGFAFDGFPVYGPYAYANSDGSGGIIRVRSSYAKRNITKRHSLPDGTALAPSQYGPDVSTTYPVGYYVEDFEYTAGSGDLDVYNGRFAVTPEYPTGIYAYYTTVDAGGVSVYPYHVGPQYYGLVASDDLTTHAHVTIGESVTTYDPLLGVGGAPLDGVALRQSRPNPASARSTITFTLAQPAHVRLELFDVAGRAVLRLVDEARPAGTQSVTFDSRALDAGVYYYRLRAGARSETRHLLVTH